MLARRIWCQGKVDVGNKRLKIQEREAVAHGTKSLKWQGGRGPYCKRDPMVIGGTLPLL